MLYRYSTIHAIDCYDSGTPRILRCDMGTENSNIAFIQPFLRRYGTDCFAGDSSFRYGRSVSNQVRYMDILMKQTMFIGWLSRLEINTPFHRTIIIIL